MTSPWLFLLFGYIATVAIEIPVLVIGLTSVPSRSQRISIGLLLTALTYPIVVLVLPAVFNLLQISSRGMYLLTAETFAPFAEVIFFRFLTSRKPTAPPARDDYVIVVANLCSFATGELGLSGLISRLIDQAFPA